MIRWLCVLLLACASTLALAQVSDPAPLRFSDRAEEQRFHALVTELRCVMCQNQSLADSNAQIAHDLRREVLTLMRQGKSDDQIRDYLVARGEADAPDIDGRVYVRGRLTPGTFAHVKVIGHTDYDLIAEPI